jgi:hypothetical protein
METVDHRSHRSRIIHTVVWSIKHINQESFLNLLHIDIPAILRGDDLIIDQQLDKYSAPWYNVRWDPSHSVLYAMCTCF